MLRLAQGADAVAGGRIQRGFELGSRPRGEHDVTTRETVYTDEFFSAQRKSARRSAGIVVPLVIALIAPRSVVDVGCGTGTWLTVFEELGVDDVLGIDGGYVEPYALEIAREQFLAHDLVQPLEVAR